MKPHLYLRAYMAGAFVPTLFVMFVVGCYVCVRYVMAINIPFEKAIIFPVAFVPNMFGLWNMLYTRLHRRHRLDLGWFGALLPFIIAPVGFASALSLGLLRLNRDYFVVLDSIRVPYGAFALAFATMLIVYYLVWKYLVGFLNRVVAAA